MGSWRRAAAGVGLTIAALGALWGAAAAPAGAQAAVPAGAQAAPPAGAQSAPATVSLLHGLPGVTADVVVAGQVVVGNFQPGQLQDLSAFAGQTLRNVEVHPAGSPSVLIGPIATLAIPATGNVTLVAHLKADGTPTLSSFTNDLSAIPAGEGRLTIRHMAAAPAIDVMVGPTRPFTALANGAQVSSLLPAGPVTQIALANAGAAASVGLPDVNLRAGEQVVVYAVGDWAKGTVVAYTQSIIGLGGAPSRVNTGVGPRPVNTTASAEPARLPLPSLPVVALAMVGLLVAASGTAVIARAWVAVTGAARR